MGLVNNCTNAHILLNFEACSILINTFHTEDNDKIKAISVKIGLKLLEDDRIAPK